MTEVERWLRYALSREEFETADAPALARAFADRFENGVLEVPQDAGLFVARRDGW